MNTASESRKPVAYKTLDFWRGFASLWVVMYHSTIAVTDVHPELQSSLWYYLSRYGGFGVWMFFVVSGYCIASAGFQAMKRGDGFPTFVHARFRRIYPTFWFSAIFYFCFAASASLLVQSGRLKSSNLASQDVLHQSPLYYLANVTLTQRIFKQDFLQGVYWTLGYEVAFYVLVGLAMLLAIKLGKPRIMLNTLHGVTAISLLTLCAVGTHSVYPFDLWAHFGLGVLVYDLIWNRGEKAPKIAMGISAIAILVFLGRNYGVDRGHLDAGGGVSLLFSLCFASALMLLHPHDEKLHNFRPVRWMAWVGMFSYSLYLTHYAIVTIISKAADMKGVAVSMFVPTRILIIIISLAFAYVFFLFCEKPFMGRKRKVIAEAAQHSSEVPATA